MHINLQDFIITSKNYTLTLTKAQLNFKSEKVKKLFEAF